MFGDILSASGQYEAGNEYTITVQPNTILQKTESTVSSALKKGWAGRYFDILNVNRTLGSGRFAITVKPKKTIPAKSGNQFVIQDFWDMGIDKPEIIQVETGTVSTQGGGLKQAVPELAKDVSQTVSRTLTAATMPLLPWLIVAGVGASIFYFYVRPMLIEKAKSAVAR